VISRGGLGCGRTGDAEGREDECSASKENFGTLSHMCKEYRDDFPITME
jgi:hypothetical protein